MAEKIFKGFKQEIEGQFTAETGYLYFVRNAANTGKTDGYLLFNGRMYGTSAEAVATLEALIGEIPEGFDSISEWIESNENAVANAIESLDERISANTAAIEAIEEVSGDFATKEEVGILGGRVDTLEAISADTRLDTLESGVQQIVSGDSSVTVTEISNGTQEVSVRLSSANDNALKLDETNGGLFAAIYYDGDDSDVE